MYGQSPLVGSTIDPRLFIHDFSTLNKANELKAQGIQNLGKGIAQGIEKFQELKKQGNLLSAEKKSDAAYIDSAIALTKDRDPAMAAKLQADRVMMDDSSLSLEQQVMIGKSLRTSFSDYLDINYKGARMFNAQNKAYGGGGSSQGGGGGGGASNGGAPAQGGFVVQ
jgi:hypothetical protein